MKLDLLTNATVVNDAMRFVSEHNKNNENNKIDNNSELLHTAAASSDVAVASVDDVMKEDSTTNKVF